MGLITMVLGLPLAPATAALVAILQQRATQLGLVA